MTFRIYPIVLAATAFAGPALAELTTSGASNEKGVRAAPVTLNKEGVCATLAAPNTIQVKGVPVAPDTIKEPGVGPSPITVEKSARINRIILVDLGERELKKRQELRSRDSHGGAGTPAPKCP